MSVYTSVDALNPAVTIAVIDRSSFSENEADYGDIMSLLANCPETEVDDAVDDVKVGFPNKIDVVIVLQFSVESDVDTKSLQVITVVSEKWIDVVGLPFDLADIWDRFVVTGIILVKY